VSLTLFVGIDPSVANTGLCILGEPPLRDRYIEVGQVMKLSCSKDKPHSILRYTDIAQTVALEIFESMFTINAVWEEANPDSEALGKPVDIIIGYEDYSYGSVNKPYTLGELGGVLKTKLLLTFQSVNMVMVPPTKLKLFATGNGGATKGMMGKQFRTEVGKVVDGVTPSNDCIDAYYLAQYAKYALYPNMVVNDVATYRQMLRHRLTVAAEDAKRIDNFLTSSPQQCRNRN